MSTEYNKEYLFKTKYCASVLENKPCFYGKNCRFAHNTAELRVNSCFFGAGCCHVWWNNGKYSNKATICSYIHPGEDKESYCNRVNLPYVEEKEDKSLGEGYLQARDVTKPVKKLDLELSTENVEEETVLKVPNALFLKALAYVDNSGKKNIRVEVY
jgi:hypothetical protein